MKHIQELIDLITLENTGENTFEGQNYQTSWGRVFGGQVLAQSLNAAYQTVPEDRFAHSLHGYFILGGNLELPITYEVDIIRDGKSFTTRRVVAFQEGRAIFNMSASFQLLQQGVDHQNSMPNYIPPEKLLSDLEQLGNYPLRPIHNIEAGRRSPQGGTLKLKPSPGDLPFHEVLPRDSVLTVGHPPHGEW